jgi:homoserine O-succinyltransferase/O-acetyltransferase
MPVEIERHRSSQEPPQRGAARRGVTDSIVIGLVNNMPDAALEATEAQFARLLNAAADASQVRLRLAFLPEVPRGPVGLQHIAAQAYWPIDTLVREPVDALIVTGMEPVAPLLSDEPYWERMGQLLQWAETNTTSSIWSCLAAHAAVERLDGVRRRRLERKRCGVFAHTTLPDEPLLEGVGAPLYTPHSRWNELPVDALRQAGYTVVSSSPETGADMFTRQTRRSLFVFFQGHPEYEETTLLREYRRDVGRFLRGQQSNYPTLPHEYFSPAALELLSAFEQRALAAPSQELFAEFPAAAIADSLRNTWGTGAAGIYRNWLARLTAARKAPAPSQALASAPSAKVSSSGL